MMESAQQTTDVIFPAFWGQQAHLYERHDERLYKDLIFSLPAYFYTVHYDGGIAKAVYHSPQCEMVTGYTPRDYLTDPDLWIAMVHPDDREMVRTVINSLCRNWSFYNGPCGANSLHLTKTFTLEGADQGFSLEHRIIHKSGGIRWITNRSVAIRSRDGSIIRIDGLVQDITAQKQAEESLEVRLAREEELVRRLQSEKMRAEQAVEENSRFMSLVVHDLRAPIASDLGFLRLIETGRCGNIAEETRSIINRIIRIDEGLLQLIEDLLSIARLKGGRIKPRHAFLDVRGVAITACEMHQLQAERKGVRLQCNILHSARVYADHTLITEVLANLISNAIKFCKAGDEVAVSLLRRDGGIIVSVADTGPGVKQGFLKDLFTYDVRTTSSGSAGERGTGFGLPLCAEIMQLHGGNLTVHSVEGHGSDFHMMFPEVLPSVLVVDDDPARRLFLEVWLKPLNVRLTCAENGEEAWNLLQNGEFHLVLSDLNMPVMGGEELLQRIRQHPGLSGLPFIALTSTSEMDLCQQLLRGGANDYIRLPVEMDEFVQRVRRHVG